VELCELRQRLHWHHTAERHIRSILAASPEPPSGSVINCANRFEPNLIQTITSNSSFVSLDVSALLRFARLDVIDNTALIELIPAMGNTIQEVREGSQSVELKISGAMEWDFPTNRPIHLQIVVIL
jgi:hypothetical protein